MVLFFCFLTCAPLRRWEKFSTPTFLSIINNARGSRRQMFFLFFFTYVHKKCLITSLSLNSNAKFMYERKKNCKNSTLTLKVVPATQILAIMCKMSLHWNQFPPVIAWHNCTKDMNKQGLNTWLQCCTFDDLRLKIACDGVKHRVEKRVETALSLMIPLHDRVNGKQY